MKYSIIIPAYNAEKTILKTIESITNNEYNKKYEIIIVNDGSSDKTLELLKKYDDPKIRVINIENSGVSNARNVGIENAKGKYILFVDSDDLVANNYFEYLDTVLNKEFDLIQFSYSEFNNKNEGKTISDLNIQEGKIDNKKMSDELKKMIYSFNDEKCMLYYTVWSKCFRKDIIEKYKLRFNNKLHVFEDGIFVIQYIKHCKKIFTTTKRIYYYRRASNSITTKIDYDKLNQNNISINLLKRIFKGIPSYNERIIYFSFESIISYFSAFLFHKDNHMKYKEKKEKYKQLYKNNILNIINSKKIKIRRLHNNRHRILYLLVYLSKYNITISFGLINIYYIILRIIKHK